MAIPSTGTDWKGGGFDVIDNRFYSRGGLAAVLIRDNRGLSTCIAPYKAGSPPTENWSPFAQDGNLREDLFALERVDGIWQVNQSSNQGFYLIGATDEKGGPERKPGIKHSDAMVLQSNYPFDSDITEENFTIGFTPVQSLYPLIRRLRMNLPLTDTSGNNLVELPGSTNYVISKPTDADEIDRQVIFLFAKKVSGQYIYTAEGYSLCRLSDAGNYKRDKTTPDAGALTFTVLPDPYHVDIDPTALPGNNLVPAMYSEWTAGSGWTATGGAPIFPGLAPIVIVTGTTTADVIFQAAVGGGTSIVYTAFKATTPYSSFSSATIGTVTANSPSEGDVTLALTGLTTSTTYKVYVTATGANTLASNSQTTATFTTN